MMKEIRVPAYKVDYKRVYLHLTVVFIICIIFLAFILWLLALMEVDNFLVLYIGVLVPFLIFFRYMRVSLRKSRLRTECELTDKGIRERPVEGSDEERFVSWTDMQTYKEGVSKGRDASPYLQIKIKGSPKDIIIRSIECAPEAYRAFYSQLKLRYAHKL